MAEQYDPQSTNAMFSRIIERLDRQDRDSFAHRGEMKEILTEIREQTQKTNGRVTAIEQWVAVHKAKVAAVVFVGSSIASFIWWLVQKLW